MVSDDLMQKVYRQMETLNKYARDIMVTYDVHACTDVTGFSLMGHGYEMAQGSGVTLHIHPDQVPFHRQALEMAQYGLIPVGAYKNRAYCEAGIDPGNTPRAMMDILFDPQTSGGLLFAVNPDQASSCLTQLKEASVEAALIGEVTEPETYSIVLG